MSANEKGPKRCERFEPKSIAMDKRHNPEPEMDTMNLPLRERRHQQAQKDFARLERLRDDTIEKLARTAIKLKATRRTIDRYERTPERPASMPAAPTNVDSPAPPPPLVTAATPAPGSLDDIPEFLRRKKEGEARDAAARVAIEAERTERQRTKSRGRIAKLKAAQAGDTKQMPLTGRAALAKIIGD